MGNMLSPWYAVHFYRIFVKLAGNQDWHKKSKEFQGARVDKEYFGLRFSEKGKGRFWPFPAYFQFSLKLCKFVLHDV